MITNPATIKTAHSINRNGFDKRFGGLKLGFFPSRIMIYFDGVRVAAAIVPIPGVGVLVPLILSWQIFTIICAL